MLRPLQYAVYIIVAAGWLGTVTYGGWKLWSFDSTPGAPAKIIPQWPVGSTLQRDAHLYTLVLMVHPQCACSRATLGELDRLMADCQGRIATTVLMLRPPNMPEAWEKTDLWKSASAIPGVHVVTDIDGKEAIRFGAATSGQAFLYDREGRLLFAGGITESRGHSGDNAGRSAITALVLGSIPPCSHTITTAVYGCSLFNRCLNPAKGKAE